MVSLLLRRCSTIVRANVRFVNRRYKGSGTQPISSLPDIEKSNECNVTNVKNIENVTSVTSVTNVENVTNVTSVKNVKNGVCFDDFRLAYRSKTTWEIVRSLVVLGFCRHEFLVDHSEKLVRAGKRILGRTLFNKLMKATFFRQFVAGENNKEIRPLIERLRSFNVSVILNYAIEDDEQGGEQEKSGLIKHDQKTRKDPREQNMYSFIRTIDDMAEATQGDGFAAIKVTALSSPETLMTVTNIIRASQSFVNSLAGEAADQRPVIGRGLQTGLLLDQLRQKYDNIDELSLRRWTNILEIRNEKLVDSIWWSNVFDGTFGLSDIATLPHQMTAKFSAEKNAELNNLIRRINVVAKHAFDTNKRVLVDAEQSYFQPAIARLSLELMRKYNKDRPSIYNTYQCYLKETFDNVSAHLALARQEDFMFGAKVVRGAYIVLERQRAAELQYSDPIHPTFEATTSMYKQVVGHVLEDITSRGNKSHIVIAGHNEETVQWAVQQVEDCQLSRGTRQIYFGQLLGMCDQLSFALADAGYNVVKCVPYGTVEEVLPYLIRRAHENRGFMEKTSKERLLLRRELLRRMKDNDIGHNPDVLVGRN